MNVDEFKAWVSRNEKKGGRRPKIDPYNKASKGKEYNPSAKEYYSAGMPEYHRYDAYLDLRKDDDDEENQEQKSREKKKDDKSRNSKSSRGAGRAAANIARNVIPKVVAVVAGAVITVTTYNEIKAHEVRATTYNTTWSWSEDYSSATMTFWNQDGIYVKEAAANIEKAEKAATCTLDGLLTYTASFKDNDDTVYTDVREVVLPALGHDLDEGVKSIVDDQYIMTYTCSRCGEEFVITVDPEEVDPTIPEFNAHWHWSEDHTDCEIELFDDNDKLVHSDHAEVVTSVVDPTCVEDGKKTFEATYTYGWTVYTNTYAESILALGHDLDEGTETLLNGDPAIDYECKRCHEHFIIAIHPNED
jgi:hypothetical protein